MAKNTSILLGEHHDKFIKEQVNSGKYNSVSEVVRAALRLFEFEEQKKDILIRKLKEGEQLGFDEDFNKDEFLSSLHKKYNSNA